MSRFFRPEKYNLATLKTHYHHLLPPLGRIAILVIAIHGLDHLFRAYVGLGPSSVDTVSNISFFVVFALLGPVLTWVVWPDLFSDAEPDEDGSPEE
jgi:hypothetical protein